MTPTLHPAIQIRPGGEPVYITSVPWDGIGPAPDARLRLLRPDERAHYTACYGTADNPVVAVTGLPLDDTLWAQYWHAAGLAARTEGSI